MAQADSKSITSYRPGGRFRRLLSHPIEPLPLVWVIALTVWATLINAALWCLPAAAFAKIDARMPVGLVWPAVDTSPACASASPWWVTAAIGLLSLIATLEALRIWRGR